MQLQRLINSPDPCYTCLPADAVLGEAVTAMSRYRKTAVAVLEDDRLIGILTRSDLLTCLGSDPGRLMTGKHLGQVMTRQPLCGHPEEPLEQALERMARSRVDHLPVVDDGRLVTVLHQRQLLQARIDLLQEAVSHLQEYIERLHDAAQD